ncbi:MAG: hypothetical protein K2V38_27185, partial [Gemmataceae bacterium]|nr:hypothetical protein [Gemmataceae bacterium]
LGAVANNTVSATLAGAKAEIHAVALSGDGASVAAGCSDGRVFVWDKQGKAKGDVVAHEGGVGGVAFHPSQPVLISAGADGTVKGWNLPLDAKLAKDKDGQEPSRTKFEFKPHAGKVTALVVNPANGQVITAGADKLVRVWDVSKGEKLEKGEKPVREIGPLDSPATVLALSRDGQLLAAGAGKAVLLWTTADGKAAGNLAQPVDVLSLGFSADKGRLLVGRSDNVAVLTELATGAELQAFPHEKAVRGAVVHPATPAVITASADTRVLISPITCARAIPVGKGSVGVAVAPGSERVLTVGPGKEVVSWNTGNGAKERAFEAAGEATAAAISKDGQRVAVGAADGSVRVYTVADGKLVGSVTAGSPVRGLAFQPTNAVLVGLLKDKDNSAVAWNVAFTPGQPAPAEFGKQLQAFPHPTAPSHLAFTPDGLFMTSGGDKQARRFRIAGDLPVKTLAHPNLVDSVAFDGTGDLLATGCHDGQLRIWDVPKNMPVKAVTAHVTNVMGQQTQNPIYAVQWTSDFKQVFTASYDKPRNGEK